MHESVLIERTDWMNGRGETAAQTVCAAPTRLVRTSSPLPLGWKVLCDVLRKDMASGRDGQHGTGRMGRDGSPPCRLFSKPIIPDSSRENSSPPQTVCKTPCQPEPLQTAGHEKQVEAGNRPPAPAAGGRRLTASRCSERGRGQPMPRVPPGLWGGYFKVCKAGAGVSGRRATLSAPPERLCKSDTFLKRKQAYF